MKLLIMLKVAGFIIRIFFFNYEQKYLVACFNCQVGASCHTCFIFILWYNLFILIIIHFFISNLVFSTITVGQNIFRLLHFAVHELCFPGNTYTDKKMYNLNAVVSRFG